MRKNNLDVMFNFFSPFARSDAVWLNSDLAFGRN